MSSGNNPINMRFPLQIGDNADPALVAQVRYVTSGIVDVNQAIAALKSQLDALSTTVKTAAASSSSTTVITSGVTSFNSETGNVLYFPYLAQVNDQRTVNAYTVQGTDDGAKIVVGAAAPITITLNSAVTPPWFAFIDNDGTSVATLSPDGGTTGTLLGAATIAPGESGIVMFDGANWWSGAIEIATNAKLGVSRVDNFSIFIDSNGYLHVPIATDSSMGLVKPDALTIGIDSGLLHTIGPSGTVPLGPLTPTGSPGHLTISGGLVSGWISPT